MNTNLRNPEPGTRNAAPSYPDRRRLHSSGGGFGCACGLRRDCARCLCRPRSASVGAGAVIAARLRDDVSPEAVVNVARELPSDAVVVSLEPRESSTSRRRADDGACPVGNRSDVLRRVRDPKALAAAFTKRSIRAPRVITRDETRPRPSEVERWMFKPRVSGGGHGVRLWQPGEAVTRGHYLQEFVEGTPGSVILRCRWQKWCHAWCDSPTRRRRCLERLDFVTAATS